MEYNINYSLIAFAYISMTAFFYSRQAKIPNRRTRLFDAMLCCCIFSISMDVAAAVMDRYALLLPTFAVYAVNILFLASVQLTGVLFFLYCINLTGAYRRMGSLPRALVMLPFAAVIATLLSSPFTEYGIFYLDGSNVYHHGALHLMLYAVMAAYILSSAVIVFIRRDKLQRVKLYTIFAFLAATLIAMLIQMNNPYLLVNTMATAFSLTLMYHILEAPSTHVDALTEVLNRTALLPVLGDIYEEGERCTALVFSLSSLHLVNHSFGMKGGDAALAAYAFDLKRQYPHRHIFRLEGNVFCVLLTGGEPISEAQLRRIFSESRREFTIAGDEVSLDFSLFAINSEDCAAAPDLASLMECVTALHLEGCLLADGEFQARLTRSEAIEKATARAMDEGRVEVYYQPIHDSSGQLCALEALVRIRDDELGFLPPQELVELAERSGAIIRLGEQVLRKTCEFISENDVALWGLDHVGVNLSAVQCVRPELAEELWAIINEYGVDPGLLAFELTETAAGALAALRENMESLLDRGLFFLLDDFGTGYANFKNMASLPYRCVKIDKSLLWNAQGSEIRMKLLRGVIKVIHALGLASLCEGVETLEQAELLRILGVNMLQGYYYSKPLTPEGLTAYAGKAAAI